MSALVKIEDSSLNVTMANLRLLHLNSWEYFSTLLSIFRFPDVCEMSL